MYTNRQGLWLYEMFYKAGNVTGLGTSPYGVDARQRFDAAARSQWGSGGGPAPFNGDLPVHLSESLRETEQQLAA